MDEHTRGHRKPEEVAVATSDATISEPSTEATVHNEDRDRLLVSRC